MRKTEQGSLVATISIILAALIVLTLGFVFWQNFLQPKDSSNSGDEGLTHKTSDAKYQIVTSTLKDWTVSLRLPDTWSVETKDDAYYNYDTRQKEPAKNTFLTHPSGKVEIVIRHMPFFSADGVCGPSTIKHLNKEAMADDGLVFVEAVSNEGSFFLSATSTAAASAITEEFNACFRYRDLINQEGRNVMPPESPIPNFKQPFVSVGIRPAFADATDSHWDSQMVIDFLSTKEYLEAKEIVKSLKI